MKKGKMHLLLFISIIFTINQYALNSEGKVDKPPLGWNSYDCYSWRVNEEEFKANVDYMKENLLEFGYEYAVVDFLWFHEDSEGAKGIKERSPDPRKLVYDENGKLTEKIYIDKFGRLIPDEIRFPSAKKGKGFKPLADYVHDQGLKFGIHIMRGIPRYAVEKNLKIKGTYRTAKDIYEIRDTCIWENTMYGIDHTKEGAQEYYNSLIELYTEWGVDFIKADDMMYPEFHKEDIRLLSNAIKNINPNIVLSLSLGEVPMTQADFLVDHANMWRISTDFWDEWEHLERAFDLTDYWSNHRGPGSWPDADMLPVGHLSLSGEPRGDERMSKFTRDEHYTLMTLWAIAKSPLMIGSNLPTMPDSTYQFLTNKEMLNVNQNSVNNRLVYKDWKDRVVWMADDPDSDNMYLALFNKADETQRIHFNFDWQYLKGKYEVTDLWHNKNLGKYELEFGIELPPHGAGLYRLKKINN